MNTAIKRALGAATVLAITTGGLLLGTGSAAASTSCQTNCITDLTVGGTPEGVVFDFDTAALSRVAVVVTDVDGSNPYVVKQDDTWGSSYNLPVDDAAHFTQGTAYRYSIYATDTGGSTWVRSGGFATLLRYASVTYNTFHVIKDGDSIGAGDFEGRSRCGNDDYWDDYALPDDHALAPLSWDREHESELSDGQQIPLFQKTACHGTVGRTIEAQTAAADDDNYGFFDIGFDYWSPKSPDLYETWSQKDFDESYTRATITDPLSPTATGSATTPVSVTSPGFDPVGALANMRYSVTGIASFTHWAPDVSLPADTSGPATLGVIVTGAVYPAIVTVSWDPTAFLAVGGPSGTLVKWREKGTSVWSSMGFLDPDEYRFPMQDLKPATTYDLVVSRQLSNGLTALATATHFTTPAQETTIDGWPTDTVTKPVGTAVSATVHVDGGAGRAVELQSHQLGLPWTVRSSAHTDASGNLTIPVKVGAGYTEWRVHALAHGTYAEAFSAARLVVAKTAITGFNSTTTSAKAGTNLSNTITVTPGSGRLLKLLYRKAGTTDWKLFKQLTADGNGNVTLSEVVASGTYQWMVNVPVGAYHGTAAVTAVRTVTGT